MASDLSNARTFVDQDEPKRRLQRFLDPILTSGGVHTALDVGCGHALAVDFPLSVHLVGMDASPEALATNENVDARILGDIETYPLPNEMYDAILCWTVLEHLASPKVALANMAQSLRPHGVLIIGVPDPWSLKGVVTKLTPHRFHVWAYRRLLGMPKAGQPGHSPFPTYLRTEIAPKRLEQLARAEGMERIYRDSYEPTLGLRNGLGLLWSLAHLLGRVATAGRWQPQLSEHVAVFRKRDSSARQP